MKINNRILVLLSALFLQPAFGDAPLKSSLGLEVEQAREVAAVQKQYRAEFRSKRGDYHREMRKLRRAKSDNDVAAISELESVITRLGDDLREIRLAENAEIRALLTPEQLVKFEQVLEARRAAKGSSRDENIFGK